MVDPFQPEPEEPKMSRFLSALKVLFFEKIPMNIFFLLIIISASIVTFQYISPMDSPTGDVILEKECPVEECPECLYEETECEQDCSLCPIKTKVEKQEIIYYKCPSGDLVEDLDDCEDNFPEVDTESSGTVEGITLSIDNIEYEEDEDDSGFVTRVDYTIINQADVPVVPRLEIKVYEEWNLKVKKNPANKKLDPEIVVSPGEYAQRKDAARIYFDGKEQTLRLLLVDTLPDPDTEVVAVTKDFEID